MPPLLRRLSIGVLPVLSLAGGCGSPASPPDVASLPREGDLPGAGGVRLHYRILGNGPPVVVVHGGPGAGMQAVLPELRPLAERFTLVVYDQRGGGLSELPADTDLLGVSQHVADLEAVRTHFDLETMSIVAHSFGAILAARYAQEHPDRVARMVFFGATGPEREAAAARARAAPAAADEATRERFGEVMQALMTGSTTDPVADCREYERLGRKLALARGEPARWTGTQCAMPADALRYYFRYTARLGPQSLGDWDFTGSLGHVEAPLLVIHGGLDRAGLDAQEAWARAVPDGRLLVLPGAGKGASADRPDLFFPAVETFLAGEWPDGAAKVSPDRSAPQE